MTVETALKALINPLVAGGCHNTVNRSASVVSPYVVFYEVVGAPDIGVADGYPEITECRYQVDVFAASPEAAKNLALGTIKAAIKGSAVLQGTLTLQMNGQYSELDKTFQYITEYQLWVT